MFSLLLLASACAAFGATTRPLAAVPFTVAALAYLGFSWLSTFAALAVYAAAAFLLIVRMCRTRWTYTVGMMQPEAARILLLPALALCALRTALPPGFEDLPLADTLAMLTLAAGAFEMAPLSEPAKGTPLRYLLAQMFASVVVNLCVAGLALLWSRDSSYLLFSVTLAIGAYAIGVAAGPYAERYYAPRLETYEVKDRAKRARRVAIIGAGATGLAYAKELNEAGHTVELFEVENAVGGVFAQCYEDAVLTTSTIVTQFSVMQEDIEPQFWTAREYVQYLQRYTDKFNLKRFIHFATSDIHATVTHGPTPTDSSATPFVVKVTWKDADGTMQEASFDHIIPAIGSNLKSADRPQFEGFEKFKGSVIHTAEFQVGKDFEGKRVAIVGCGESAADISLLVAEHAKKVYVSSRDFINSGWFVPRYYFGHVSDLDTSWVHHALPQWLVRLHDRYSMYPIWAMGLIFRKPEWVLWAKWTLSKNVASLETYGIKNLSLATAIAEHDSELVGDVVRFTEDGIVIDSGAEIKVDAVILAVGFKLEFDSLISSPDNSVDVSTLCKIDSLYLNCLDPKQSPHYPVIPGGFQRPHFGSIPPLSEVQGRYIAALLADIIPTPDPEHMCADIAAWREERVRFFGEKTANRVRPLVGPIPYSSRLAARLGCDPPMWFYMMRDPLLWIWLLMGSYVSSRFRLVGPGADPEYARWAIMRYRLSYMSYAHGLALAIIYPLQLLGVNMFIEKSIINNHEDYVAPLPSTEPSAAIKKVE